MKISIITPLSLSLLAISIWSCDNGNVHISTAEEIQKQVDSVQHIQTVMSYNEGKLLFSNYCNTCHYPPEKHMLDQYLFDNLFERLPSPSEEYFVNYISDSKTLKTSGNEYAKQVDEAWNQDYEHNFKDSLSKRDFYNLITYIKSASKQRYLKAANTDLPK